MHFYGSVVQTVDMGQLVFLFVLLAVILSLLVPGMQRRLQITFQRHPAAVWIAPPLLTLYFIAAGITAGASNMTLGLMVLAYTAAPVLCVFVQGAVIAPKPSALDFASILLLGFPSNSPPALSSCRKPHKDFCTASFTASPLCSA